MNIRDAIYDDAKDIAIIQVAAWNLAYQKFLPKIYLNSMSIASIALDWQIIFKQKSRGINLVIEQDQCVSGFCVYGPVRDSDLRVSNAAELVAINILPQFWRKGLASALLQYVINATNNHYSFLYLWVIKGNSPAIKLYQSLGFEPDGEQKTDNDLTGYSLTQIRYCRKLT